jgi:hypothetical protein
MFFKIKLEENLHKKDAKKRFILMKFSFLLIDLSRLYYQLS